MGFEKIAFTDHCPEKNEIDKRENVRMKYSQKEEYLSSIKDLKEKYVDKIQIESGFEVEYLPGEEENLIELKRETDKIILGQHFIYDNDKQLKIFGKNSYFTEEELMRYAEYIEKAMELNIPDIIAHPDIYLMDRKDFGAIENKVANTICRAAEKFNIPLEINLAQVFNETYYEDRKLNSESIERQKKKLSRVPYPRKEFWKVASNYDIKVLYGIDVHRRGQILKVNELVELANEIIGKEIIERFRFIEE